jgi:hypothetical protein
MVLTSLLCCCMQLPAEWITHNTVNFQPPAARTFDLASYPKLEQSGPRAEQVTAAAAVATPSELKRQRQAYSIQHLKTCMSTNRRTL